MKKLCGFISELPATDKAKDYSVYPESVNAVDGGYLFMVSGDEADYLVATGAAAEKFEGEAVTCDSCTYVIAPKTHKNADVLRAILPFTAPSPVLKQKRSFGVGDRLGIALIFRDDYTLFFPVGSVCRADACGAGEGVVLIFKVGVGGVLFPNAIEDLFRKVEREL